MALSRLVNDIVDYFESDNQNEEPLVAAVVGEAGSGKSLFGRCLYEALRKRRDFLRDPDSKAILTGALNAETQMQYLGIWRPVLRMMLGLLCRRSNSQPETVACRLIKGLREEAQNMVLSIFGLPPLRPPQAPSDPLWFVKRERPIEEVAETLVDFVKEVLGEKTEESSESNTMKSYPGFSECPVFVILDNVSLMDESSWRFLEMLRDECQRIAFVLLIQTDGNNKIRTSVPEALENVKIIELLPWRVEDLNLAVQEVAHKYQASMQEEITLMTRIEDPSKSIKDPAVCVEKERELKKKYFCNYSFTSISKEVLELAITRCEGNPMLCL